MKIIGTSDILKDIRQSKGISSENSLIFQYPFMMDKSLEKKWGNTLRDFFTLQFLSQIKVNNVLKTVINAVPSDAVINSKGINPAERLQQSLGRLTNLDTKFDATTAAQNYYYSNYKDNLQNQVYQNQIDDFRKFIYNQIKIDPIYRNLRPSFSNISLSNDIQIPLILGTKSYSIPESVLYWILFVAVGQGLRLDNPSDFGKISKFLKEIPEDRYMEFLYNVKTPLPYHDLKGSARVLTNYVNNVGDNVDKFLRFFHVFLNEKRWSQELGTGTSLEDDDLSGTNITSTAFDLTKNSSISLIRRASSLFSGFVAQDIVPLLRSSINAIISNTEVDVVQKLDDFNDSIISDISSYYDDIMNHLKDGLSGLRNNRHSLDTAEDLISIAKQMCKDNKNIDVTRIFEKLSNSHFSISGSPSDLSNFLETLEIESSKLSVYSKNLVSNLKEISLNSPGLDSLLSSQFKTFNSALNTLFLGHSGSDNPIFKTFSSRFSTLTGSKGDSKVFIQVVISSVSEILYFLSLYSFFSYLCEYLYEVHASVKVQKRDAVDFPNFVLVLPIYMLKGIYFALASRQFSDLLAGNENTRFKDFRMTETKINRIIGALNSRLHIPNIIVVDDKMNRIYYRWMYFKSNNAIAQLDIPSVENYIKHQSEALHIR